jgi:aromatic ring-opening dioxygenase catalytic subunit (LigB family)
MSGSILRGFVLPGLPQPLLTPNAHTGYERLRQGFLKVSEMIDEVNPDVILIYSTMWASVLGHQIQGRKNLEWTHVDDDFHDLGSIKYNFSMDTELAKKICEAGESRGLQMKFVDYHGFPLDTGSVVALKLINEKQKRPAVVFSSNVYADRAETVVLAKAAQEALKTQGKKAVAIVISTLSNRLHQDVLTPAQLKTEEKVHSLKDQEWNLKVLEFLGKGRLEDVAQLSRQIQKEARVKKVNNFKPMWWLSSVMGAHNRYKGEVLAYEPVYGTGSAIVALTPAAEAARDLEFDEDSPEFYAGERNVLASVGTVHKDGSFESTGMTSQSLNAGFEDEE